MNSINDCELQVKAAKDELARAEESLNRSREAVLNSIKITNCPKCPGLLNIGGLPDKEGSRTNSVVCPDCLRTYDAVIVFDGKATYEPASYSISLILTGYRVDGYSDDRLFFELAKEKKYVQEAGDKAIPERWLRLRALMDEQLRRNEPKPDEPAPGVLERIKSRLSARAD
jgi:hypothetical protein